MIKLLNAAVLLLLVAQDPARGIPEVPPPAEVRAAFLKLLDRPRVPPDPKTLPVPSGAGLAGCFEQAVSIAVAPARVDTLLAFLSSGCTTCAAFWEAFRDERRLGLPGGTRLVVVTRGPGRESPARHAPDAQA